MYMVRQALNGSIKLSRSDVKSKTTYMYMVRQALNGPKTFQLVMYDLLHSAKMPKIITLQFGII
jgi:hypothetical protein